MTKPKKGVYKFCEYCGKTFYARPSLAQKARFCSKACAAKVSSQLRVKRWKQEGYCPDHTKLKGRRIVCEECGKTFRVNAWQKDKRRFCSKECRGKWLGKVQRGKDHPGWNSEKRICKVCGEPFFISASELEKGEQRGGEYGQFCSRSCQSKFQVGENSPNWGGGPEERACEQCGEIFSACRAEINVGNGRFCSKRCWDEYAVGENSPAWQGGLSFEPYPSGFNERLKRQIRERDNYTCVVCGAEDSREVHHCNYQKADCTPHNLVTLCRSCHSRTNVDRPMWQAFFEGRRRVPVRWIPIAEYRHMEFR